MCICRNARMQERARACFYMCIYIYIYDCMYKCARARPYLQPFFLCLPFSPVQICPMSVNQRCTSHPHTPLTGASSTTSTIERTARNTERTIMHKHVQTRRRTRVRSKTAEPSSVSSMFLCYVGDITTHCVNL